MGLRLNPGFYPLSTFCQIITTHDDKWYSVRVSYDVYKWLEAQDQSLWIDRATEGPYYQSIDIHEELFLLIRLKFNV